MSILVIHPVEHFLSHCCRVLCDGIHIHSTECQPQPQGDSMSNSGRFTTMEEKRKDHQRSEGTFFFGHLLVVSKEKIGSLSHTQIIVKVYHCFRSIPSLSNNSSGTKTKNKTLLDWYKNGNTFGILEASCNSLMATNQETLPGGAQEAPQELSPATHRKHIGNSIIFPWR